MTQADESHRAGAESYQKIMKYFKPGFLLGMTATPERTDAYSICEDFDYNIAYEIRLQQAMMEDMLCPFHYFGVTEMVVDGQIIQDNNFMIPIALSGDRSFNKDTIRRYVCEGSRVIHGCSTVNFDDISKKRIFASIDNSNFSSSKLINESYQNLKYRLGRIPNLMDFEEHAAVYVARIFENASMRSYYFLVKYEPEYTISGVICHEEQRR